MKPAWWIAWAGFVLTAGGLGAQEAMEGVDRDRGSDRRSESFPEHLERGDLDRGPGLEIPEAARRWLAELKERDPAAYRKFMRLQERNPDRFRMEVHRAMSARGAESRESDRGCAGEEGGGRPPRETEPGFPGRGEPGFRSPPLPPDGDPERMGPDLSPAGPHGKVEPGSGPRPGPYPVLETWLRGLKERNPDEYERLMRLREENPEQFHREIRSKLQKIREERLRQDGEGRENPAQGENPADRVNFEKALKKNVVAWRAAGSEEDRARIEREIREQVRAGFQRRMRAQEDRLEELERQIAELRSQMARQREGADRIVEERVRMMLRPEGGPAREVGSPDRPQGVAPGDRGSTPK